MANMRWTNEWINSDGKHCRFVFNGEDPQP